MTPTPLRVAMVLPTYLPESFGGAEQQCRKLCRAFDDLGIHVTILAPRMQAATPSRETLGRTNIVRFRVRRAPNLGGRHLPSFLLWFVKVTWWLYAQRASYDVIHVIHGRLHAVPAAVAGRLLGKPVLIKLGRGGAHFDLKVVKEKRLGGPLFWRLVAHLPTAFIANSREIVADLHADGIPDSRVYRLPNGVELPSISARRRERVFGDSAVRFLFIGRLDPEKALDRMITGFAALGAGARARLTIVGDGSCGAELAALVRQLGVSEHVTILPPVADVGPLLHDADFHVSTSLSEGMSNALLESMSWGTPAIVSRVSGVEDIVGDGLSGHVFEPGDDAGYVAAMARAMAMTPGEWQAMSDAAFETVRERFAIEGVAERHIAIYKSLMDRDQFLSQTQSEP